MYASIYIYIYIYIWQRPINPYPRALTTETEGNTPAVVATVGVVVVAIVVGLSAPVLKVSIGASSCAAIPQTVERSALASVCVLCCSRWTSGLTGLCCGLSSAPPEWSPEASSIVRRREQCSSSCASLSSSPRRGSASFASFVASFPEASRPWAARATLGGSAMSEVVLRRADESMSQTAV